MYEFFKVLYIDGLMLTWIIYGNILFFSDKNNCESIPGTRGMYKLMFAFLIVGYLMIFTYLIIVCSNKCLCIIVREPPLTSAQSDQANKILKVISSEIYTKDEFKHDN